MKDPNLLSHFELFELPYVFFILQGRLMDLTPLVVSAGSTDQMMRRPQRIVGRVWIRDQPVCEIYQHTHTQLEVI